MLSVYRKHIQKPLWRPSTDASKEQGGPYCSCSRGRPQVLRCILDKKLPPEALRRMLFISSHVSLPLKILQHYCLQQIPLVKTHWPASMKGMCREVQLKTNHSLRATGISQLFQAGVPERLIQQRSGNRSLTISAYYP